MNFNPENQSQASKEIVALLGEVFSDQFEEQKALAMAKGGLFLEDKEAFCQKKITEFDKSRDDAQEKIVDGIMAFLSKDDKNSTILSMFKHFDKLADLKDEDRLNKSTMEILEISKEDFLTLYNMASDELNHANYQIAADMFTFLNWLHPMMYYCWINLGLAESMLGRHSEAKEIFHSCLELFPEEPILYIYAANNSYMLNEMDEAKELLKQGINLAEAANDQKSLKLAEQLTEAFKLQKTG